MESLLAAVFTSLWLGILTSISPCPLATNIAAVSYIGKHVGSGSHAVWAGVLYVVGRMLSYIVVGAIVTAGVLSIPGVSNFLQKYMNSLLGPILILVGLVLLGWLSFTVPGISPSEKMQKRATRGSLWWASFLGAIFALSFCPISAALFFGSLIPLSVKHQSYILLPSLYGIGTGLPVLVVGITLAFSVKSISGLFVGIQRFESWVRIATAVIFILIGIYMILRHVFVLF